MGETLARRATAFAPGHVTGLFRPVTAAPDPRGRGSVGLGVVLELGVRATATFRAGGPRRVRVAGDGAGSLPISTDVAQRLRGPEGGTLTIDLRHELPVGQGFGMSAAGATATALAVGALFGVPRVHAIGVAHLADLFGGGGLGGVAAIQGGGLEIRRTPGVPPFGEVLHRPFHPALVVGLLGDPLPSPRVLGDRRILARIEAAASEIEGLGIHPSPDDYFAASERFTDQVGLASPVVRAALRGIRRRGAWAAQAMFGQSFVALPRSRAARTAVIDWLGRSGIRAVELGAARSGARVGRTPGASRRTEAPLRP